MKLRVGVGYAFVFLLFILSLFFSRSLLVIQKAHAAAITSAQTGNWNESSTWVGGSIPGDGDTATIAAGHTVTVNVNTTVGTTSGTAHGVLIKGTSAVSYGKLIVSDGVTLKLKGVSRTYYAMKVERYGQFVPQPGSTVQIDATSDGQTGILAEGIIDARGTQAKPIRFTVPAANYNWAAVQAAIARPSSAAWWPYDEDQSIACVELAKTRISNAAGTGIGSVGDTSIVITLQSPATILQTEVASLAAVTSAGKYYVDYWTGFIYFYHVYTDGNPSFTIAHKYLDDATANWRGWFIDFAYSANNDVTYNEGWFDHCIFEYMGSQGGTKMPAIRVGYKYSAAVAANRDFYVTNSVFQACGPSIGFTRVCTGTAADPLLIDSNQFLGCSYSAADSGNQNVFLYPSGSNAISYLTVSNNTIRSRRFFETTGSQQTHDHLRLVDNTSVGSISFYDDFGPPSGLLSDGEISGNDVDGVGLADQWCRLLMDISGASGHPLLIYDNLFRHGRTGIQVDANVQIYRNVFTHPYYVAITGGSGFSGYSSNVLVENNLFYGKGTRRTTAPAYETYETNGAVWLKPPSVGSGIWYDDWTIINNTFANIRYGGFELGSTGGQVVHTNCKFANNLVFGGTYAAQMVADGTARVTRGGLSEFDYNLFHDQATGIYIGLNRGATFIKGGTNYNLQPSPTRNIPGVYLWNPNYSSNQAGRDLVLTVTGLDSDMTLAWGGGAAQQLIWQASSALTSDAALLPMSWGLSMQWRLTDTSKTWNTDANNAACPKARFIKMTSGTQAGQIFAVMTNTATTLDLTPVPATLPLSGDTYVMYHSQLTLPDDATGTVVAGIDPRSLPTTTQSDAGITIAVDRSPTGDPNLVNPTGLTVNDYKTTVGGAGIDTGTADNAPATDYWGTSRPQGAGYDVGAYEYPNAPPTVTIQAASAVTTSGATLNGNITDIGGENATERGFKLYAGGTCAGGIIQNPHDNGSYGIGAYTKDATGLNPNVSYSYTAYAINPGGTGTSVCEPFTTLVNKPSAPTVNASSTVSLTTIINTNGNPDTTEYAISCDADGTFLNYTTNACEAIVDNGDHWRTYANWGGDGGFTDTGLSANTQHTYKVKARNTIKAETALSDPTAKYTLIEAVSGITFSGITTSAISATSTNTPSNLGSGTSGIQICNTTISVCSTWQQNVNPWQSTPLNSSTEYTFTAQSRNGNGTVTTLFNGPGNTQSTLVPPPPPPPPPGGGSSCTGGCTAAYNYKIALTAKLAAAKRALINLKTQSAGTPASYNASFVVQVGTSSVVKGQQKTLYLFYKNTGTSVWLNNGSNPVRIGNSSPHDRGSVFEGGGNVRWNMLQNAVYPGQVGVFRVTITAPNQTGSYTEKFQPVVEFKTWMGPEATFNFRVH